MYRVSKNFFTINVNLYNLVKQPLEIKDIIEINK